MNNYLTRYNSNGATMVRQLAVLSILFFTSLNTYSLDKNEFRDAISKAAGEYNTFSSSNETMRLFVEGKVSTSVEQLKNLVPDDKKTFYDFFILANMVFKSDFETSYRYMKLAENFEKDNPYVLFERGIHEHRRGNYVAAVKYYQRFKKSDQGKNHHMVSAYLTHSYLMTGDTEKAIESWKLADFGNRHTSIEKGMYTIFSNSNQDGDREKLISKIKLGATYNLCNLRHLDSNWEIDWWNYKPREDYLEYDSTLAKEVLKKGSLEEQYFNFCSSDEKLSDPEYMAKLTSLDIIEGKNRLPESSTLIYSILKRLTSSKLMTPEDFLSRFENQIQGFSKKHPKDAKYYDILAFLYSHTGNQDKLKTVDGYGWKELKIEKYAASYVFGMDPKSELFETTLKEALIDFPLSATLNEVNLSVQSKDKSDAMAKYVAAQFANVKKNWLGPYRLSDYMTSLRHELNKLDEK
jgi:hypothetical protein